MTGKSKVKNQKSKILLKYVYKIFGLSLRIILTILLTWGMVSHRVWAQGEEDVAPTPTPTPAEEQVGTSDEELEALKEEVKEKVSERLQNIVFQKVALVGTVAELTEEALVVETRRGKKAATVSEETVFVDQRDGDKEIDREDLEIGATVIAMGWKKADEEITDARRLVLVDEIERVDKRVVVGSVSEIGADEDIITLVDLNNNQEWQVEFAKKGQILTKEDGEFVESEWDEIEEDSQIIAAGVKLEPEEKVTPTPEDEEESDEQLELEARLIYIYPPEPTPTPEPSPTPGESKEVDESDADENVANDEEVEEGE
jgi:hypothetical protein